LVQQSYAPANMTLCRELQFLQLRWSSVASPSVRTFVFLILINHNSICTPKLCTIRFLTLLISTLDSDSAAECRYLVSLPTLGGMVVWYSMVNISDSVVEINIDIYVSTVTVHRIPNHNSSCRCLQENLCESFPFDADLLSWLANKIQSIFAHTPDANQRAMP
jgi:hypothetical protein